MITYSHLLTVYHLVSDARIIRVNLKPNVCQTLRKLTLAQKACNHLSIQRILELYKQLFHTLFFGCDVRLVHTWGYLHHYIHQESTNLDKHHVLFIFYLRLNKCVWGIDKSDIPLFLCINNS